MPYDTYIVTYHTRDLTHDINNVNVFFFERDLSEALFKNLDAIDIFFQNGYQIDTPLQNGDHPNN